MKPEFVANESKIVNDVAQITVAAPRSEYGRAAAHLIAKQLRHTVARVECLDDPAPATLATAPGPVAVVGNLADSAAVRDLYFRFLCATDLWYPGPGGYEVRRLVKPFGNGHDGLLVGYSDGSGAEAVAEHAVHMLTAADAPAFDVHATRLPMADDHVREIREARINPDEIFMDRGLTNDDWKGFLYYLTGEAKLGEEYRAVWQKYLTLKCMHLPSLNKFLPFMLCETMGAFASDERSAIYQYIWDWAEGPEGHAVVSKARVSNGPTTPRSNHELIPALTLVYVSEFFKARFPNCQEPREWRHVADQTYVNMRSSWKDGCDGLCHDWYLSQPAIVLYGLIDPEHRFYNEGGARAAAECAIAIVNNSGWMPSAGHSDLYRQFPGPTLRTAAVWFNDGRYRFVHELAPLHRRLTWRAPIGFLRAFDSGVTPVEPRDHIGITVIPVDPAYYNKAFSYPPAVAQFIDQTPPNVPIEQCFDKIAVRAGWQRDDDYLLLDGITGGGHSFNDACGILDYARFGASCLIGAPTDNGLNTDMMIVRDAETGPTPEYARLEARECDADGNAYLRFTLSDYGGTDWTREVFFRPKACMVVCDTITAKSVGDYVVEAIFRTPGKATLADRALRWSCQAPDSAHVDFQLAGLSMDGASMTAMLKPDNAWGETEARRRVWEERYHNKAYSITECRTRMAVRLRSGSYLRLAHIAQIRGPDEPELRLVVTDGRLMVTGGKYPWNLRDWPEQASSPVAAVADRGSGNPRPPDAATAGNPHSAVAAVADRGSGKPRPTDAATVGSPHSAVAVVADRGSVMVQKRHFTAKHKITCLNPAGDHLLLGTESGEIIRLDADQKPLWSKRLPGRINCIAENSAAGGAEQLILAGFGNQGIWIGTSAGETVQQFEFTYRATAWPWCQLPSAGVVAAVGVRYGGKTCFVVGTGDNYVHLYDAEGNEIWHFLFPSLSVPGYLRIVRYGKSDEPRILVASRVHGYKSHLLLLDPDGGFVAAPPSLAPVGASLAGFTTAEIGKRVLVAVGATCDPNLQIFDLARLDDLSPYPIKVHIPAHAPADDPRRFSGCRLWEKSMGGGVTGVAFDDAAGRVFASTNLGFVTAYDLDGKRLWCRLFPVSLTGLVCIGTLLMVIDSAGKLYILNPDGELTDTCESSQLQFVFAGLGNQVWGVAENSVMSVGV